MTDFPNKNKTKQSFRVGNEKISNFLIEAVDNVSSAPDLNFPGHF